MLIDADIDKFMAGDGRWAAQPGAGLRLVEMASTPRGVEIADGFQQALLLEQHALCDALSTAPRPVQEKLTPLIADLYAILRTPIFPKGGYRMVAEALVKAAGGDGDVQLRCVLAGPTAAAEVGAFLHCAALFKRYGFTPRIRLLLVQWENLVEIRQRDVASRAHAFAQQVRAVAEAARQAGLADAVSPVNVEIDVESGEALYPHDFAEWSRRVGDAADDPRNACPALVRDATWSARFYARQVSLSRLGDKQALLDLAIRRAIGGRVSAEQDHLSRTDGGLLVMLTSELHKRLLTCYAASAPIMNVDVRKQVSAQSKSA